MFKFYLNLLIVILLAPCVVATLFSYIRIDIHISGKYIKGILCACDVNEKRVRLRCRPHMVFKMFRWEN